MARPWNHLLEQYRLFNFKRLFDETPTRFVAKDLDQAEEQNRARFLELCCVWIGRNFKDYFETIAVVSDIISRLAIPEPKSEIFSVNRRLPSHLFDPPSHTYRVLVRRWPDQKVLIAQTAETFQESKELDYEQIDTEFDDLEYRLNWVKKAILRQHENLADYVAYWRRPQWSGWSEVSVAGSCCILRGGGCRFCYLAVNG